MSVQVSYKKQFTFYVLSLLIILAVIEGGARLYENQEKPCHFIGMDAFNNVPISIQEKKCMDNRMITYIEPDILRFAPNQKTESITINSFGFRGPEITLEKPPDTFRIFIVGGSTTFGAGSFSDEETIPGYLQKLFEKTDKNVEIINAGINSGYSYSERFLVENDLQDFNPDMIILYTGGNDSHRPTINPTITYGDYGLNIKDLKFWRTPFVISDIFIETTRYEKSNNNIDESFTKEKIAYWTENMKSICSTNSNNQITTIVTLHPILATSQKIFSPDEKKYSEKSNFQSTPTSLKIYDGIGENLKILSNFCDDTYDLRSVFTGISEPIFFDESHINAKGNMIVAEKLFAIISTYI